MKKAKRYRGSARVEFLACKPEIDGMIDKGFTIRMIFDALKEKGKISIGYLQFSRYVSGRTGTCKKLAAIQDDTSIQSKDTQEKIEIVKTVSASSAGAKILDLSTGKVAPIDTSLIDGFQRNNFNRTEEE